jgi:LysM repeat protein
VVEQDQVRVWAARLAAPAAFFLAAIVLVLLVQSAISSNSPGDTGAPTSALPTTTEPGTTNETPGKKRFYKVRRGDTLESIAAKFGTSVDDLLVLNPRIDPLALSPGERVRVR